MSRYSITLPDGTHVPMKADSEEHARAILAITHGPEVAQRARIEPEHIPLFLQRQTS